MVLKSGLMYHSSKRLTVPSAILAFLAKSSWLKNVLSRDCLKDGMAHYYDRYLLFVNYVGVS